MTAATTPVSGYLASFLLVLTALLAAGNWYLEPDRAGAWTAAVVFLMVLTLALWTALRRWRDIPARRQAADAVRNGLAAIVFAALMMAAPLAAKLAYALGAIEDKDLAQRLTMVTLGAFFMFTGNAMPKMLPPVSAVQCDGAKAQAVRRFTGWTWVVTGLAFAGVWLVLPVDIAEPVSLTVLLGGVLAVVAQCVRVRRTTYEEV
jgi:hypothetical protein